MKFDDFMEKTVEKFPVIDAVGDAIYNYLPIVIAAPILTVAFFIPVVLLYWAYHILTPKALQDKWNK